MASAAQLPDPGGRPGLRYRVRTPENVFFEFEIAGLATRCVAWLIDLLVLAVGSLGVSAMMMILPLPAAYKDAAAMVAVFAFIWGYHIYFEYAREGATIGKKRTGVQVISDDGLPIDLWQAVV